MSECVNVCKFTGVSPYILTAAPGNIQELFIPESMTVIANHLMFVTREHNHARQSTSVPVCELLYCTYSFKCTMTN